ncbi:GIY-YIG nuclease family protein [Reyranella sp.]|jgi:hypothetical protein|uniref:GIY-YIG nuclease family protein n=1 Tax=Reyranella sp. TaxID=1929291 RepID=UPI002F91CBF9
MPLDDGVPPGERPEGFVYLLHCPAMSGIYKIGCTARNPYERARELSGSTGVPVPYSVVSAVFVKNCFIVEGHLHRAFDECRVNSSREFFCFADHDHARRRFRDEVMSLSGQVDDFGFENVDHDLKALANALREKQELEGQVRQLAAKISTLQERVRNMESQHRAALADLDMRSSRMLSAYKQNSDHLARRIAEIRDYCTTNRTALAGSIIDLIENLRPPK